MSLHAEQLARVTSTVTSRGAAAKPTQ